MSSAAGAESCLVSEEGLVASELDAGAAAAAAAEAGDGDAGSAAAGAGTCAA